MKKMTLSIMFLAAFASANTLLAGDIPEVKELGAEEYAGAMGRLVNIATDSKDQPHIIADVGHSTVSYFYDKIGNTWRSSSFNSGGQSPQSYNPHIEINNSDQAWYSVVKWWSHGMGLMIRQNISTSPSGVLKYTRTSGGTGGLPISNLSLDVNSVNKCVVYGGNGGWYDKVLWTGSSFAPDGGDHIGTLDVGPGGEKNYFWISRAGNVQHANGENHPVWHACSDWSYNNSVRKAAGKPGISWMGTSYYAYSGHDGCYPMVVGDNKEPQTAYLFTDYRQFGGPGVMMQIWKGTDANGNGHFVFNLNNLLNVDPQGTSALNRYEPQLAPALDGGVWACYSTFDNHIRIRFIPSDATGVADLGPIIQFAGTRGAIAVDSKGNLHVAYSNNGVKYRKITINSTATVITTRAGDYNGDGIDDPTTYNPETFRWFVLDGANTNNTLTPAGGLLFGSEGDVPVVGHFKNDAGDGAPAGNVISASAPRTDQIGVFNAATGTWKYRNLLGDTTVTTITGWGYGGVMAVPADYDGDGLDDLAIFDPDTGGWFVKPAKQDGKIIIWADIWGSEGDRPVIGDYDGDGKADLATFNPNNGFWNIRKKQDIILRADQWGFGGSTIVPGDYDGDGTNDLAVYGNGKWYIRGSRGTNLWGESWGTPDMIPVSGDYDGDGRDDLALFQPSSGTWYIKRAEPNGDVILWGEQWGTPDMVPVPGDYDGDGTNDLALFHPSDGKWYIKKAQHRGDVILMGEPWGTVGMTPVPGDYDGDGTNDLALYNEANGHWYIKPARHNAPAILWDFWWGFQGTSPVAGDYDGDGLSDLAVYNREDGLWYIRKLNSNEKFVFGAHVGAFGTPISGDYNGDGKDDMTIVGYGYYWISKTVPEVLLRDSQHGLSGFVPVPGDYDGDGKADRAVWNPETGKWYIVSGTSGTHVVWDYQLGAAGMLPLSGDFSGNGVNDLNAWNPGYEQNHSQWYSRDADTKDAILWSLPWGGEGEAAIGAQFY